ncbi:MAG: hypothetical protein AB1758_36180 [Candidatus Eremiobacterota bacterium]
MRWMTTSDPIPPREALRMARIEHRDAQFADSIKALRQQVTEVADAIKQQDGQGQDHDTRAGLVTLSAEASNVLGRLRPVVVGDGEKVVEATLKFDPASGSVSHLAALTYGDSCLVRYSFESSRYGTLYRRDVRADQASNDKHQVLVEKPGLRPEYSQRGWRPNLRDISLGGIFGGGIIGALATGIPFGAAALTGSPIGTVIGASALCGILGGFGSESFLGFIIGGAVGAALGAAGAFGGWWALGGAAVLGAVTGAILGGAEAQGRARKPEFF